jgi:hypothetical protein
MFDLKENHNDILSNKRKAEPYELIKKIYNSKGI